LLDEKQHLAKHMPLGELIYLDRERCIQCARCVRFQHNIVDDPVINFYQRGRSFEIQTSSDPGFDSYFSGNTTDICPVGALTTADFRFEARPWEMKSSASICSQCPVGCNITFNVRREARSDGHHVIKRVMPRQNENVNEIWICDKGRFAYHFTGSNERLVTPLVRKDGQLVPASWEEALNRTASKMQAAGSSLVTLAGGRLPNEDLFTLRKLTQAQGGKAVLSSYMAGGDLTANVGVEKGTNFSDMGKGTVILVAASDLQEEAPVWFLRVKQAVDRGAVLITVNPRPTKLDRYAKYAIPYLYGEEASAVAALLPKQADQSNEALKAASEILAQAENLVVMYGSEGLGLAGSEALSRVCAQILTETGHVGRPNNGLVAVWAHANDQGAWDMGFRPDTDLANSLSQAGVVYVAAADPAGDDPALAQALEKSGFVVVQELFLTPTAQMADVVLPAAAYTEREGTFTSGERFVQRFYPAIPMRVGTNPDYAIAIELGKLLGHNLDGRSCALIFQNIAAEVPAYAGLNYPGLSQVEEQWPIVGRSDLYYGGTTYDNHQGLGAHLSPSSALGQLPDLGEVKRTSRLVAPEGTLLVVPVARLYDRGVTVLPSKLLHQRIAGPSFCLHPDTALKFGLVEGLETQITIYGVTCPVTVWFDPTAPLDVALLPRSVGLPIQEPVAIKVQTPAVKVQ
jgi:NADH-quinone oxidoreductase subunit G